MEKVNRKVIIIAVLLALVTTFLVYIYIKRTTAAPETEVSMVKVYVAAKTLDAKYKITAADIKQITVGKEAVNSKAVLNKADIVGKRLRDSIIEGEQILGDRLVRDDELTLAYRVPVGKRAVSINVAEQVNVSNLIRPGDYVDVLASFESDEFEDEGGKTAFLKVTKLLLQNLEILAMGQEQLLTDEKLKELPKTVTLAVDPADAEKLVFASEFGILRLALRNTDDEGTVNTPGIIRDDLMPSKSLIFIPKE